jgi:hypothetical protein
VVVRRYHAIGHRFVITPMRQRLLSKFTVAVLAIHAGLAAPEATWSVPTTPRDGGHDFDFEIGEWRTDLRRLKDPLSGSTTWIEYSGRSSVGKVLGGRANLVELSVEGSAGRIEGASLRLYDPQARQWSLNFFNVADGHLTAPMIGEFVNGRGVFYGQDTYKGRSIFVRFVISKLSATAYRFEQAFSPDGGVTWEINWIATDTRR